MSLQVSIAVSVYCPLKRHLYDSGPISPCLLSEVISTEDNSQCDVYHAVKEWFQFLLIPNLLYGSVINPVSTGDVSMDSRCFFLLGPFIYSFKNILDQ